MFLLNIGNKWTNHDRVDGVVINAAGVHITQVERRNLTTEPKVLLFDPQLYLSGLEMDVCEKACSRLSTYPWFGGSDVEFDSDVYTQKEWFDEHKETMIWPYTLPQSNKDIRECIKTCFDFQVALGVTQLIIPTPLIEDIENEFETQLKWIDVALELKSEFYDIEMLATVAFCDHIVIHQDPLENRAVQSIIDNISARSELDGAYIIPVQTGSNSIRITQLRVATTLLHISHIVGHQNEKKVIINFADSFGFACLGVGATAYGGGYTNKTRRMNLSDYIDAGGGGAYPKFHSHQLLLDFLSERDLTKIRDSRLLRLIKNDQTDASEDLFDALGAGLSANDVPPWRESLNNVTRATIHKIERSLMACSELQYIGTNMDVRFEYILEWLQNAEAYHLLLDSRFNTAPLSDDERHIAVWSRAFDNFQNNTR